MCYQWNKIVTINKSSCRCHHQHHSKRFMFVMFAIFVGGWWCFVVVVSFNSTSFCFPICDRAMILFIENCTYWFLYIQKFKSLLSGFGRIQKKHAEEAIQKIDCRPVYALCVNAINCSYKQIYVILLYFIIIIIIVIDCFFFFINAMFLCYLVVVAVVVLVNIYIYKSY